MSFYIVVQLIQHWFAIKLDDCLIHFNSLPVRLKYNECLKVNNNKIVV